MNDEQEKVVVSTPKRDDQGRFVKRTPVAKKDENAAKAADVKNAAESAPKVENTAKPASKPTEKKAEAPKNDAVKETKVAEEKPAKTEQPKAAKAAPKKSAPAKAAKDTKKTVGTHHVVNRVERRYREEIVPELMKKFNYKSVMQVPKLHKIVLNMGVGDALQNSKLLDDAVKELSLIAGQHPVVTKAKKSIAAYKLREGQKIGCKVTLRGTRMYDFYDKLISIALPRVRDFRGVSKNAFDGHGNYTLGVKEQLIFAEIDFDQVNKIRGLDIVIVTTAKTDEEAYALLEALGMPFQR
jgi:large subunit ribosomal protein L5